MVFQFTHPGRGATRGWRIGERTYHVSIHAPREGCDIPNEAIALLILEFQFTHPGRGATVRVVQTITRHVVSIHAPREGCDYTLHSKSTQRR